MTSVIFCGTSPFAVPSLEALAKDPAFTVNLVITQPDRPVGRKQVLTPPPVKMAAKKLGLRVFQPEKLNTEFSEARCPKPDFLVVVSYGQILSQAILDFPAVAPINVHASLLPHWRGASPLQHAILHGDTESGVTVQRMVKELDAGPILAQEKYLLQERETFHSLHDTLAAMGAKLLIETLKHPLKETAQDERKVTLCRQLSRKDAEVDPSSMTAIEIDRRVRALNPWPGVTVTLKGQAVKILTSSLAQEENALPLDCKGGTTLFLLTVQPAGKKPMKGAEWMRGTR